MNKVFVIIEDNGYDGCNPPHNEVFYLSEEEAQKDANILNKGYKKDYFHVFELTIKTI